MSLISARSQFRSSSGLGLGTVLLEATKSELAQIAFLSEREPPTFSCNQKTEVWPNVGKGYHHQSARDHIQGLNPLLDEIVEQFLRLKPRGGRFIVTQLGAYAADGRRPFLRFTHPE